MASENTEHPGNELSAPLSGYTSTDGIAVSGCAQDISEVTHDCDAQSTLHIPANRWKDVTDILRTETSIAEITHNLLSNDLASTGGSLNQPGDDP